MATYYKIEICQRFTCIQPLLSIGDESRLTPHFTVDGCHLAWPRKQLIMQANQFKVVRIGCCLLSHLCCQRLQFSRCCWSLFFIQSLAVLRYVHMFTYRGLPSFIHSSVQWPPHAPPDALLHSCVHALSHCHLHSISPDSAAGT